MLEQEDQFLRTHFRTASPRLPAFPSTSNVVDFTGAHRPRRGTLGRTLGMPASSHWYVYILRCGDQSLYTGIARNVKARIASHEAGRGARYTRGRGPFVLCATRCCETQGEALRLEYAIKRLTRAQKEGLTLPRRLAAFARRASSVLSASKSLDT